MKRIIETAVASNTAFYEFKFLKQASEDTKALWRKTFFDMFGDSAILSLSSIADFQTKGAVQTNEEFLFAAGLVVVPLLFLSVIIGIWARQYERFKLAKEYNLVALSSSFSVK